MNNVRLALISAIVCLATANSFGQTTLPETRPFGLDPSTAPATQPQAYVAALPMTQEPEWQFSLGLPIWLPGLDGNLNIRGTELSPNQDAEDVIDILDERLNFALMLHAEARKGRVGFFLEALYIDLRADGNLGLTDAETSVKGFIGEAALFYSIVAPASEQRKLGTFRLDALGGLRLSAIELGIEGQVADLSVDDTFYDPMVGLRMELGLTEWLALKVRGDVAGFGISAWRTSDFSYNFDAALAFYLGETFEVDLGYRWLKYEFVYESGLSTFDATLGGPYVALTFHF